MIAQKQQTALLSVILFIAISLSGCSGEQVDASDTSDSSVIQLQGICDLFTKADDATQETDVRTQFSLELYTEARLLAQSNPEYSELKLAAEDYYASFQELLAIENSGVTGPVEMDLTDYLSAKDFIIASCKDLG